MQSTLHLIKVVKGKLSRPLLDIRRLDSRIVFVYFFLCGTSLQNTNVLTMVNTLSTRMITSGISYLELGVWI